MVEHDHKLSPEDLKKAVETLPEDVLRKYGAEALIYKLELLSPSDNEMENLKVCKNLVSTYLLDAEESEVDEAILAMKMKFDLKPQVRSILAKFCKEQRKKYNTKRKEEDVETEYDLDSTSGRAKICRDFADIFISNQKLKGAPVKCINGHLRLYQYGIYPESDKVLPFIENDIMNIGLLNGVNLTPNLIEQIIKLIKMTCPVSIEDCEPDSEFVVVLNNGIFDMRDWTFHNFNPEAVYFSKIPVDYDANAAPPVHFLRFIDTCFEGNEQQKDLLQEVFGYTLTKSYKYQDVFYILGDGGNGKGSAMRILTAMLGTENITSFSLLQLTDGEHIDYNVAMLFGKHANICGDVGTAKVKNTETLKKLSSNTDLVTGRHVREKPFQFLNYAKMIFLMNRAPETDANTTGDSRRIRTINFMNSFSEKKNEIKDIHKVIIDSGELPGILLWALDGLKRLEHNKGFTDHRSIVDRAIEYDKKSNTMRYFVEECLYEDPGSIVPNEIIYELYNAFRKKIGGAQLGKNELKNSLLKECKDAGWQFVTNKQMRISQLPENMKKTMQLLNPRGQPRCFIGIGIVTDEPQKTIEKFAVPDVKKPRADMAYSDAERYDMMQEEIGDGKRNNTKTN